MYVCHGETNMVMVAWLMYLDTCSVWTILTSAQYAPPGYPHLGPVDLQPIISLITFFK